MARMSAAVQKILATFARHGVEVGACLPKAELTREIQSWTPALKQELRGAWHVLVGEGLIREGDPRGPMLTARGRAALDQLPRD
jgi:hypothetical protein